MLVLMLNLDKCALTHIQLFVFFIIKVKVISNIVQNCKGSAFICVHSISTKHAFIKQRKKNSFSFEQECFWKTLKVFTSQVKVKNESGSSSNAWMIQNAAFPEALGTFSHHAPNSPWCSAWSTVTCMPMRANMRCLLHRRCVIFII